MKEDEPKVDTRKGNKKDKEPGDKANRLGLILSPLTEDEKKELKLRNGLKVEQNVGSSRGGLQEGDVILSMVTRGAVMELRTVDQLNQLLAKIETGSSVTFQIRRGESTAFLSMRVGE